MDGSATPMCAPRDAGARHLAVLGVLSTGAPRFRQAARDTWLSELSSGSSILTRFVMRAAGGASAELIAEHRTHGDIVFVNAPAGLERAAGPLRSIFLWWECALRAWPNVHLIGKADEDTWLHLRGVASLLARSVRECERTLRLKPVRLCAPIETPNVYNYLQPYHKSQSLWQTGASWNPTNGTFASMKQLRSSLPFVPRDQRNLAKEIAKPSNCPHTLGSHQLTRASSGPSTLPRARYFSCRRRSSSAW